MSVDTLYVMRSTAPRGDFNDLDLVVLTADVVDDEAATVKAGTRGTIVGVWESGAEYEVEFSAFGSLATVSADALRRDRTED